ncbi:MAG: type IV secretory system conjugative DNA transfer family protein [Phycisphaerales bacterium]|nr:type IV secretory system conjugative DNA transfer family protein [Phycisphaerales bacterium]
MTGQTSTPKQPSLGEIHYEEWAAHAPVWQQKLYRYFKVHPYEVQLLLRRYPNPQAKVKRWLYLIGFLLSPITVMGIMWGFFRGYKRFMLDEDQKNDLLPDLNRTIPIVRFAMFAGAVLIWVFIILAIILLAIIWAVFFQDKDIYVFMIYAVANLIATSLIFMVYKRWRSSIARLNLEGNKFGTARFATYSDVVEYTQGEGLYIGEALIFSDKGHLLTVAGTRGGKGTNLIIPNLLGLGNYQGSWVVIDPKGENAAITIRAQEASGRKVVILNPWGLLTDHIKESSAYNPLDILADISNINFVDDVAVIAEMIVPMNADEKDNFFTDNARAIIAGLIMHLMTQDHDSAVTEESSYEQTAEDIISFPPKTLSTLWQWLRLNEESWDKLLAKMSSNDNPYCGLAVRTAANEIIKLQQAGEKTFGSIIATALQSTNFLNSPALQTSLKSDFNPYQLADGNSSLYIIIPVDKLKSHARWLRLVVTSTMRAVVRKPNKKVAFLLDEFAALGYMSEIEIALSTYAGYEVTIWCILQSLIQLRDVYGNNWESFIANSSVRHFFNVSDNFSADYISHAMGKTSRVTYSGTSIFNITNADSTPRELITPDELRRESGKTIFAFLADKPPLRIHKHPYYEDAELLALADKNPYFKE